MTHDDAIIDLVTDAAMEAVDIICFDISRDSIRRHMRAAVFTALEGMTLHEDMSYTGMMPRDCGFVYKLPTAA
jgi:hypothetical protein